MIAIFKQDKDFGFIGSISKPTGRVVSAKKTRPYKDTTGTEIPNVFEDYTEDVQEFMKTPVVWGEYISTTIAEMFDDLGITKLLNESATSARLLGGVSAARNKDGEVFPIARMLSSSEEEASVAQLAMVDRYNALYESFIGENGLIEFCNKMLYSYLFMKNFSITESEHMTFEYARLQSMIELAVINHKYPLNFVSELAAKSGAQSITDI